jgi:hypothetical protein
MVWAREGEGRGSEKRCFMTLGRKGGGREGDREREARRRPGWVTGGQEIGQNDTGRKRDLRARSGVQDGSERATSGGAERLAESHIYGASKGSCWCLALSPGCRQALYCDTPPCDSLWKREGESCESV